MSEIRWHEAHALVIFPRKLFHNFAIHPPRKTRTTISLNFWCRQRNCRNALLKLLRMWLSYFIVFSVEERRPGLQEMHRRDFKTTSPQSILSKSHFIHSLVVTQHQIPSCVSFCLKDQFQYIRIRHILFGCIFMNILEGNISLPLVKHKCLLETDTSYNEHDIKNLLIANVFFINLD